MLTTSSTAPSGARSGTQRKAPGFSAAAFLLQRASFLGFRFHAGLFGLDLLCGGGRDDPRLVLGLDGRGDRRLGRSIGCAHGWPTADATGATPIIRPMMARPSDHA
jgi:hypothetical protein